VDLVGQAQRVINKVRPLVGHDGWLVTINNALFVSGREYYACWKTCAQMAICRSKNCCQSRLISPVSETRVGQPPGRPGTVQPLYQNRYPARQAQRFACHLNRMFVMLRRSRNITNILFVKTGVGALAATGGQGQSFGLDLYQPGLLGLAHDLGGIIG
jgi:hypothetical protein